jgi:type IV pilus assembly protein PilA
MYLAAIRNSRRRRRGRQRGFSLIELLIVISIIIVLLLFLLPYARGPKIQTNETSAVNTIKSIYEAELIYSSTYPSKGYTCNLSDLGPPPAGQPQGPTGARLLPADITDTKARDGYTFTLQGCVIVPNGTRVVNYQVIATPEVPGTTGNRAFCSDADGTVHNDPSGNAQACLSQR